MKTLQSNTSRIGSPFTCHVLLRNGSHFGRGARKEWSMRVARHLPEMWTQEDGAAIRAAADALKIRIR